MSKDDRIKWLRSRIHHAIAVNHVMTMTLVIISAWLAFYSYEHMGPFILTSSITIQWVLENQKAYRIYFSEDLDED